MTYTEKYTIKHTRQERLAWIWTIGDQLHEPLEPKVHAYKLDMAPTFKGALAPYKFSENGKKLQISLKNCANVAKLEY